MGKKVTNLFDRQVRLVLKSKRKYLKYKKHGVREHRKWLKYLRIRRNYESIEWPTWTEYSRPQGNIRSRQY